MRLPFREASRRRQESRAALTAALDSTVEASKIAAIRANIEAIDDAGGSSKVAWIAIGISALGLAAAIASLVVALWPSEDETANSRAETAQAYAVRLAARVDELERGDETLYRYARGLYAVCAISRQWGDAYPKEYAFAKGIGSVCDEVGIPDERVGRKLGDYPDEINP